MECLTDHSKNEENSTLWIRGEPQSSVAIIDKNIKFLCSPSKHDWLVGHQEDVINTCMQLIKRQEPYALQGSRSRWDAS